MDSKIVIDEVIDKKSSQKGKACQDLDRKIHEMPLDDSLIEEIVKCYGRNMLNFGIHLCGDPDDAQDTLQDAYEAIHRYLPKFRGDSTLKTWIYRIISSACIKRRRGRKNNPDLHVKPHDLEAEHRMPMPLVSQSSPELKASQREMLERLSSAMMELKPQDRAVLMLRDGQGASTKEVSEMLGLSVPAVKSKLHRSRKALRSIIDKQMKREG